MNKIYIKSLETTDTDKTLSKGQIEILKKQYNERYVKTKQLIEEYYNKYAVESKYEDFTVTDAKECLLVDILKELLEKIG